MQGLHLGLRMDLADAVVAGDERERCHVEEEAVFDYADDGANLDAVLLDRRWIRGAVEDDVALVGDVDGAVGMMAQLRVEVERFELWRARLERHLVDFDGQREAAEGVVTQLGGRRDDVEAAMQRSRRSSRRRLRRRL